jgi:hypothetical protein
MKAKYFEVIEGIEVVVTIADAPVDPVKTEAEVLPLVTEETTREEFAGLCQDHTVYANLVGAILVDDSAAALDSGKLKNLQEHQRLTMAGAVIPDFRGVEYWKKTASR